MCVYPFKLFPNNLCVPYSVLSYHFHAMFHFSHTTTPKKKECTDLNPIFVDTQFYYPSELIIDQLVEILVVEPVHLGLNPHMYERASRGIVSFR